jgi:hypothetical protein
MKSSLTIPVTLHFEGQVNRAQFAELAEALGQAVKNEAQEHGFTPVKAAIMLEKVSVTNPATGKAIEFLI